MPWNAITEADVIGEFTPVEQAVLKQISGSTSVANILNGVLNAARGAIVAGGNQLGPVGTIADQVREDVIAIARWKYLTSFPALKSLQTSERKAAADEAQKRLDNVSTGKPKIEIPANPIGTTAPVGAVQVARPGVCVRPESFNRIGTT